MPCDEALNQVVIDQSKFWDSNGIHWDTHRIGWAIAGGSAAITLIISTISVMQHCRNYTKPRQQRQILRILYMPPIYAIISFLSYRFFRYYTYYSLVYIAYEAVTLSAFLLLIIEYVAATATGNSADKAIERKDKRPLPIPFCFWRYRPTKPYFMYTVKWSVLQYVIVRPAVSVASIVCEHFQVLCASEGFTWRYANVYLEAINFVSISIALYGLFVFYGLVSEELKGKRPVAKFLSIKLIVMFTFYQAFVFNALEGRVIKATTYWTATNISDGLNALTICIEMVIFAGLMWWAYTAEEYRRKEGAPATGVLKPLWDSINYTDFMREIASSMRFFLGKSQPATGAAISAIPTSGKTSGYHRAPGSPDRPMTFGEAFGIEGQQRRPDTYAYPLQQTGSAVLGGRQRVAEDDKEEQEALTWQSVESAGGKESMLSSQEAVYQGHQNLRYPAQRQSPSPPSQHTARGQPIPRSLQPSHPASQPQRPDPEAEVDLAYYHSAYSQLGNHPPPAPPSSFNAPPSQQQAGSARDSYQVWSGPRAI